MAVTYQDVVRANLAYDAWALVEAGGTDFAPYIGLAHLTGAGAFLYQQAGPFATSEAVHLAVGATLRTPAGIILGGPATEEVWVKLDAAIPAALTIIGYWGNSAANGQGIVVDTDGLIKWYTPGPGLVSTGVPLGAGWHLIQWGNVSGGGGNVAVSKDGVIIFQGNAGAGTNGNPNQIGFGCSSSAGAATGVSFSFPALYASGLDPQLAYSSFLASTDPATAINATVTGQFSGNGILQRILDAVTVRAY